MTEPETEADGTAAAGANWLLSMADLLSILVTFFVMLFSMSTVQTEKWRQLTDVLTVARPPVVDQTGPEQVPEPALLPRAGQTAERDLGYLGALFREKLAADPLLRGALLARTEDGLVIGLPSQLLFAPGRAEPPAEARQAIARLADMLRTLGNQVEVRGHTDPTPIGTAEFPSNWELSLARARSVAAALWRAGYVKPITVLGQADARFGDLPPAPEAERRQLARRVDVILRPNAAEPAP